MYDDISEAFSKIELGDFIRPTSAVAQTHTSTPGTGSIEGFLAFTETGHRIAMHAYEARGDGGLDAIVTMRSTSLTRTFLPEPDESTRQYYERLHREAKAMDATWLHIAAVYPAMIGLALEQAEDIPLDQIPLHLISYVEATDLGLSVVRAWPLEDGIPGEPEDGDGLHSPMLQSILPK